MYRLRFVACSLWFVVRCALRVVGCSFIVVFLLSHVARCCFCSLFVAVCGFTFVGLLAVC